MGIGSPLCIINLLIVPVGNVLMMLSCQDKGTEEFSRQSTWISCNYFNHMNIN